MIAERYDAFVSYGHGDAEWVHVLAGNLERLGLRVFLDVWELVAGDLISVQLQRGLTAADSVVFVVSADSVDRGWVNEEFAAAVTGAAAGQQRLIPVICGNVRLPAFVASHLYVDFRDAGSPAAYEAKVRELAAAIRGQPGRARPRAGGPAPGASRAEGPPTAARSAYLQQVQRIAPPDPPGLIGREVEMAELAGFCMKPNLGSYVWWQAGPWAGKSALLSTFVLRPPRGVQVVSFFITARLAAQDTREAFIEVLLEQLAVLTGQELPSVLPEATREAYLLELLDVAAGGCQRAEERLVLVVDGLDEDRGVITGPDAHSIAGLLPARPPPGMRVIVAGRRNPPIPDDVPDWHPLRDPEIIRPLEDSPYARDVQRLSRQELQRLLHGTATEQDLLGLLTAARGGLCGPDLEELTGTPLWEIEQVLHTMAGRTFTRRASQWTADTGPEVYLLGHEELHTAAYRYLGNHRLASYRDRLHGWADTYCARDWPPKTPEYLLSGYFQLLSTIGDLHRMVTCASDLARHDRMLDLTGGDAAALAEIRTALDLVAAQDAPDLADALRLALHRDQLSDRNTNISTWLPVAWAALGLTTRAEALAASITNPQQQAEALIQLAEALTKMGQLQQAAVIASQAEIAAHAIPDQEMQERALTAVAETLIEMGQYQQAETAAHAITDLDQRAYALAAVARALAETGQHQLAAAAVTQAEAAAHAITGLFERERALAAVAETLAEMRQHQQAETIARAITHPYLQAEALTRVTEALTRAGDNQSAQRVAAVSCTVGRWTTVARSVLTLDSSAFTAIEHLLAYMRTDSTGSNLP